jgi:nitrogen fixation NifU-like protein
MAYSEKVVEHYENPRNVGSFDKGDDSVGTGMVGAPACGDVMKLQIKVNADTGLIEDARFKTYGCGSAIASSSLVTEWVKGKSLDEALTIKNTQIAEELALPPVKIHCSILAEDAIKAAVQDYKAKHVTATATSLNQATMAVTLTEAAARHVSRYINRRGKGVGVRLGVKTTGCSGLAYKLEYADEVAPRTWSSKATA